MHLRERSVETRPLFPPVHAFPHYDRGLQFPMAQAISKSGLSLPSYPDLTETDIRIISSRVREFFEGVEIGTAKVENSIRFEEARQVV
jgi:perosamine synthetase